MKTIILAAALLSVSSVVSANYVNDIVLGMSSTEQKDILSKTLQASGKSCSYASKAVYIGLTTEDDAYWTVQCPSESYMIQIPSDPNANSRITECSLMKSIGVDCWQKL